MSGKIAVFIICLWLLVLPAAGQSSADVSRWRSAMDNPSVSAGDKTWYADSLLLFYRKSNADSALFFARELLKYAVEVSDTGAVDYATMYLGSLHRKKGNYDSSLYYYDLAMKSYEERNFEEGIASVYNNVATVYTTQNRYDLAIKNYYGAFEVFKDSKNYNASANIYSNFAELYYKLENYEKAYEYWQVAMSTYAKSEESPYEITNSSRGLAKIYLHRNQLDSAWAEINSALDLDRANQVPVFIVEDFLLEMELANRRADSERLERVGDTVRGMLPSIDLPKVWARYYELRGNEPALFKNPQRSAAYYDSCLVYLDAAEVPEDRLRVLKSQFEMSLMGGLVFEEQETYREIMELEGVVSGLRRDRITQEMDATYSLRENEKMIVVLNEKNKTAEELVRKEQEITEQNQRQILLLWIGIFAICGFVIYGIFIYRRLRSTKKELEVNVQQKDFLFKELNHRVKNNLAIVNSFLGIEMDGKPAEVQQLLRDCENRIHSMGLMHEMLYKSETTGQVELKSYFEKLVEFISKSLADNRAEISLAVKDGVRLSSDKTVLLGLIVNELMTNAMKYAKHPDRELEISLEVVQEKNELIITVRDNGVGLKPDFNPQKSESLGMKLAFGLTKQLHGTFSYSSPDQGSEFEIRLAVAE